jgi:hypothetical protein
VSEQKPEKSQKSTPWWLPILFAGVVGWLFNNLITIATFLGLGIVHISHIGIVPFLAALGVSVVLCALGFILGIKFCVYLLLSTFEIIFDRFRHPPTVASSKPSVTPEQLLALTNPIAPPQLPTSRLESIRSKVAEAGEELLYWVLIPRKYRKYR